MRLLSAGLLVSALAAALLVPAQALALDPVYTGRFSSLALGGYDPVAYFVDGRPVEGSDEHELSWNGATWRFSSAENQARFQADPEAHAPQYGGYCAWAVSQGKTASADPERWKIVGGKLYLNYNGAIQQRWEKDVPGFIAAADEYWPGILAGK
ncbi:MAG: YHS domain-containing protein [Deltaproteobacteria bacterium]|nr:YHS domain-containing protein [Deltaproteobacteria bacterium]MBW2392945.1 YHS domain-containing protein [Deltaproteobacteria bacterium]